MPGEGARPTQPKTRERLGKCRPGALPRRAFRFLPLLVLLGCSGIAAQAASFKLIKVLPQYLDREGRHAISPSLFDRDAYQARLRRRPEERSGLRFAVQWNAPDAASLRLRVELLGARGAEPTKAVLEESVQHHGWFSNWSVLKMAGEEYKNFGELVAWRTSLWDGNHQIAERKSFLWQ